MQKIISLFQRNYNSDRLVRDEVTPGAEWVINGEGIATRKWDGTCCKFENGVLYKRYDAKKGKTPPIGFVPAQDPDPVTGHWPGWLMVSEADHEDKWFREGLAWMDKYNISKLDGTYELIGPKINANKESFTAHRIIPHGDNLDDGIDYENVPRAFGKLKDWFANVNIEGIVWHHPDGRMVKIKKKDFGYKW